MPTTTRFRLPKDPENWTGYHADAAILRAKKLFDRYEAGVDFTWPNEKINELYRPYQIARDVAVEVATHTRWRKQEAEMLP